MADLEKFRRHIGKPIPFKITNQDGEEDEFQIYPLNVEEFGELMTVSQNLEKNVDKETSKELIESYKKIFKRSYQDIDDETLRNFIVNNLNEVSKAIQKMMPEASEEDRKKAMREFQKKHNQQTDGSS